MNFPDPQKSKIMQLQDLFSASQISAMRSVATATTNAETYAPGLTELQRDNIYKFAAENNCDLSVSFWKQIQSDLNSGDCIIIFAKDNIVTIELGAKSVRFARHLGEELKRGYAMFWVNANREISWENWKQTYASLTPGTIDAQIYDHELSAREIKRITTARKKEQEFYDLARPIRSKKGGRCRISFEEARAQRVRTERLIAEGRVLCEANRIFASI